MRYEQLCSSPLGEKMKFLVGLEHLDVSCNKECGGGFSAMASSLCFLTHIKCLELRMCCLTQEDAQTLGECVCVVTVCYSKKLMLSDTLSLIIFR